MRRIGNKEKTDRRRARDLVVRHGSEQAFPEGGRFTLNDYCPSGRLSGRMFNYESFKSLLRVVRCSMNPKFNSPIRELKDMSPEEIAKIEERYGAKCLK